jgi:hypothetical protein
MKNKMIPLFLLCLLAATSLSGSILSQLNSHNDHGIWFIQTATVKLPCDWSVKFKTEERWGADYKKVWQYQFETVFQYNILKYFPQCCLKLSKLTIGPGYNSTWQLEKNTNSVWHWVRINRSILEANVAFTLGEWIIKQRLRGEYYDYTKHHYKDYGLYRHRLEICAPWKFTCYKLSPFISNEWFLRNDTYSSTHTHGLVGTYYQNRLRVGFINHIAECYDTSIFWQWRASKQKPGTHPGWFYNYHYCASLDFSF